MLPRLVLLVVLALPAHAATETFYLGTYTNGTASQGIYFGTLDTDTGVLSPLQLAAPVKADPTYLALSPNRRYLFAALSDSIASFQIQPDGTLKEISREPCGAKNICYVTLDHAGRELFAVSYDNGVLVVFPVGVDGRIGPSTQTIPFTGSGPNRDRQQSSHPHCIVLDSENQFLYVCDLGADRIWILHRSDKGQITPANEPCVSVPPGYGPRHLTFSPDGKYVYVVNELGVCTSVYLRSRSSGNLTLINSYGNLAENNWPKGTGSAEIAVDAAGKWLLVSTRLCDFITVFRLNPRFDPEKARRPHGPSVYSYIGLEADAFTRRYAFPSPVKFPRSFALDPTGHWLIVAGETDNRIAVMKFDPATGHLTPTSATANLPRPVCVLFR